jgi:hypothetical protein
MQALLANGCLDYGTFYLPTTGCIVKPVFEPLQPILNQPETAISGHIN